MKGIVQKLGYVALALMLLLTACEKDGKNDWLYSEGKDFQPISNLTGESGYGYALLRWELPEKADQLTMIDVSWINTENEREYKKLTHFEDSLWLDLEMKDYTFRVTSCGVSGRTATDSVVLHVPDWRTEPVENVQNMVTTVIENGMYLKWEANNSRAFAKATFQLYAANGELVNTIIRMKGESVNAEFTDLEYKTDYLLRYYSENLAGITSDTVSLSFTTDRKAPEMPQIELLDRKGETDRMGNTIVTTVYAYSTEIQWKNTEPDIDSMRVSFTGLGGEKCDFYFSVAAEKGYLTLLPGGTVALAVSIKMVGDTEWSGSKAQTITTKKPDATYVFRAPNGPDAKSKIGESFAKISGMAYGGPGQTYKFSDFVEKCPEMFKIQVKPLMLDEIELFPTIETLIVGGDNQPTGGTPGQKQGPPVLEEFVDVVAKLVKLKTIQIHDGYNAEMRKNLVQTFTDKSKYPQLTVTDLNGKELSIENDKVVKK